MSLSDVRTLIERPVGFKAASPEDLKSADARRELADTIQQNLDLVKEAYDNDTAYELSDEDWTNLHKQLWCWFCLSLRLMYSVVNLPGRSASDEYRRYDMLSSRAELLRHHRNHLPRGVKPLAC